MSGTTAPPWQFAVTPAVPELEPLSVRLPEDGRPEISAGPRALARRLAQRLGGLRLELAADGRLTAHWGRGSGYARWAGSWTAVGDASDPYALVVVSATGGVGLSLDGWLTHDGAGTRLDALYLSPGNGGAWPCAARVRAELHPVSSLPDTPSAAGARKETARDPWDRTFEGTLTPQDREGDALPGHPVSVAFGPPPVVCRETTAPAMVLNSTEPGAEWALLWIAHCTDSAEFTVSAACGAADAGETRLAVRYGPDHEDVGSPVLNVPHGHPLPPGFALPVRAGTGQARFTLRGARIIGTIELTGRHPFTGEPQVYRAELVAREVDRADSGRTVNGPPDSEPLPSPRDLSGGWRGLLGPLRRLDLPGEAGSSPGRGPWRLAEPDRAVTADNTAFVRLFHPLDLAVGLVRPAAGGGRGGPPRPTVLTRTVAPPRSPRATALWHDRIELRAFAQRLAVERRYAEARPLLRRALALYRNAAATTADPVARHNEGISALQILEHQTLCDSALRDERALVDRLEHAARLRASLLGAGPSGTGGVPYTKELVTGTLLAMLGQAHRLGHWREMLDTDEERIAQVQAAEPFHHRLVGVLLDLEAPDAALLAAEAGRARAFADLLGRAGGRTSARTRTRRPGVLAAGEADGAIADGVSGNGADGVADEEVWVFGAPPPLNEERLLRLLARHGHPVIAYFLAGDRLVRWTATPEGGLSSHTRQVSTRRLEDAVDAVRRAGRPGGDADPRQVRESLRWLAELLWPAEGEIRLPADPDSPVTLVPHGKLFQVPFAALPDSSGTPLVRRHALTVLPALSLLEGLLDRRDARRRRPVRPPELLAFVDPEPMPAGLPALPWTRESFPLVAEVYGEGRSTVYSGRAATAARLAATAGEASVLCLATHAEAYGTGGAGGDRGDQDDRDDPMDSFVALARTADHDGRLRARDLPGLRLGADLVILSACDSGSGRITADGVIGLGRSFLVRGPTSVLLTLSPVGEEESLDLVYRFHEHWLTGGAGRAAALRRAQLAWAEMYPDDPGRWACFALLGLGD